MRINNIAHAASPAFKAFVNRNAVQRCRTEKKRNELFCLK